jgi:hypothetical protein
VAAQRCSSCVTLAAHLLPAAFDAFCASWGEMSPAEAISAANKRDLCCFGRVLPLTEETMSMTPIIFVLIILLFGFDSTGQLETGRKDSRS